MLLSLEITLILFILIISVIMVGIIWERLGSFYHRKYTLFEFIFIMIYFSEQFIFLLLYGLVQNYRVLWVSLIVLIVVTTVSLERLLMHIRQRRSSAILSTSLEERKDLLNRINNQERRIENLHKINEELMGFIDKILKKRSKEKP